MHNLYASKWSFEGLNNQVALKSGIVPESMLPTDSSYSIKNSS